MALRVWVCVHGFGSDGWLSALSLLVEFHVVVRFLVLVFFHLGFSLMCRCCSCVSGVPCGVQYHVLVQYRVLVEYRVLVQYRVGFSIMGWWSIMGGAVSCGGAVRGLVEYHVGVGIMCWCRLRCWWCFLSCCCYRCSLSPGWCVICMGGAVSFVVT